jgi:TRAP transporter TAXI family solute receptor
VALATVWACLAAGPTFAQEKIELRLASTGEGTSWHVYATGLTEIIKSRLPEGSRIERVEVAGAIGTVWMLQGSKADIGLSFAVTSADACGGGDIFKKKQGKVRALLGGMDAYYFGTFATKKSDVSSWEQIAEGKNNFWLLTPRKGGVGEQAVLHILGLLGSSLSDVIQRGGFIESTARTTAARQIKDDLADGWASVITKGHPMAAQIVTMNDIVMLPLPERVISGMVEKYGWADVTMPPNTVKGQTQGVRTVKAVTNILVADSVPDDVVYTITKAIMENADKLPKIHVALTDFDPKTAADLGLNGNCPLHPGAAKYYKDAGLLK